MTVTENDVYMTLDLPKRLVEVPGTTNEINRIDEFKSLLKHWKE